MLMIKEFAEAVIDFAINPQSKKYGTFERLLGFSGTAGIFALPGAIKNTMKTVELVVCDAVKGEHEEACHNNFQNAHFYTNIIAYGSAIFGELYLMSMVLD
jgi:hypothetical protein